MSNQKPSVLQMSENAINYIGNRTQAVTYSLFDFIKTNLEGFLGFLLDRNILSVGIGLIVATQVNKITTIFVESVISPILNRIMGSNSDKFKDYRVEVFGVKFELGNLITQFINMILTLFIIYLIWRVSLLPNFKSITDKFNIIKEGTPTSKIKTVITVPSTTIVH